MGAFCTIAMTLLLMVYAGYKLDILMARKSVDIVSTVSEGHFDDGFVFGAD